MGNKKKYCHYNREFKMTYNKIGSSKQKHCAFPWHFVNIPVALHVFSKKFQLVGTVSYQCGMCSVYMTSLINK